MDEKSVRTLQEFAEELAKQLETKVSKNYGLACKAETHPVVKTNVEKEGITVRFEGSRVSPTVYADDAYQRYLDGDFTISEVADRMCEKVYDAYNRAPEMPELTPEGAKRHITLTLVNTEKNQALLDKTPHMEILGGELSAIPRWQLDEGASFVVSNELCSTIGLTPDEVLTIGQQHINDQNFKAISMQEVLSEMMGGYFMDLPPMEGPQMIVLSSENKLHGASALLSEEALNNVHDKIGDFVVLPSSIHEVICLPITEKMDPAELKSMVSEVNLGYVAPEERLSDQIFKHDGHKLTVVGESFKMDTPKVDAPKMDGQTVRMAM